VRRQLQTGRAGARACSTTDVRVVSLEPNTITDIFSNIRTVGV
jgi:hypothetical protein